MTRQESRIKSLEKRATDIEADIEELASDTDSNLNALFQEMQHGFNQAHDFIQAEVVSRLDDHTKRLDHMQADISEIKDMLKQLFQGKQNG